MQSACEPLKLEAAWGAIDVDDTFILGGWHVQTSKFE